MAAKRESRNGGSGVLYDAGSRCDGCPAQGDDGRELLDKCLDFAWQF
jgi:hypothetical protein